MCGIILFMCHSLDVTLSVIVCHISTCSSHRRCRMRFFVIVRQPLVGQSLLIVEASWSYSVTHTTLGRTPLDEWSARRRDFYLTTNNTQHETDIHAPGGFRTRILSKGATAELRPRPRAAGIGRITTSLIIVPYLAWIKRPNFLSLLLTGLSDWKALTSGILMPNSFCYG
jgi:hypothetical protein